MPDVSDGIRPCFGPNSFSRMVAVAFLQTISASLIDRDRRERSGLAFAFGAYVFSPPASFAWGQCSELACVGRGDLKNKPCLLLTERTSLKTVLMQSDMEIMFAFLFFQCHWCISKLSATDPSHQAGTRPAAWDRCWPERPLTHSTFQIASDRCQGGHEAPVRSFVLQPYTLTFKASDIGLVKEQARHTQ